MNQELVQNNIELAKKQNLESGYFLLHQKYGTLSGNRYSISTTVIHAIKENGKLYNKTFIERKETDLIRKSEPTKSTESTHLKKISKLKEKYSILGEIEN